MAACGFRFDKDVARASGMNESTYANLWKGDRKGLPYADRAVQIARALRTTVEYLVTGEGDQSIEPVDPEYLEFCRLLKGLSTRELAEARGYLSRYLEDRRLGRADRGDGKAAAG